MHAHSTDREEENYNATSSIHTHDSPHVTTNLTKWQPAGLYNLIMKVKVLNLSKKKQKNNKNTKNPCTNLNITLEITIIILL